MSRRRPRRPQGNALIVISSLFLLAGLLRLADGPALALATEVAGRIASDGAAEANAEPAICKSDEDLSALIATLRDRSVELDQREAALNRRTQALNLSQQEIESSLARMEAAETGLRETLALADGAAGADIDRLTAVYESMKPKDAAAVFETMDPTFSSGFLARMRPDKAAAIMAGLSPQTAYAISILLAGRNSSVPTQ